MRRAPIDRRGFLGLAAVAGLAGCRATSSRGSGALPTPRAEPGLDVLPGQWRPAFPWEQIAWVRTPWSHPLFPDYVWLDFPEAIFTRDGLLFLSHVNPGIPARFHDLPRVPWHATPGGIGYARTLPNGVVFGGTVARRGDLDVDLELFLDNRSAEPLVGITLQTCAFLRAAAEFSEFSQDNKLVHVPGRGWLRFDEALATEPRGTCCLGWRGGPPVADLPVLVARGRDTRHLLAMTWFADTLSLVGNPLHPCLHADPRFPDLAPGERHTIHGRLAFHEGPPDELAARLGF